MGWLPFFNDMDGQKMVTSHFGGSPSLEKIRRGLRIDMPSTLISGVGISLFLGWVEGGLKSLEHSGWSERCVFLEPLEVDDKDDDDDDDDGYQWLLYNGYIMVINGY